MKKRTKKQPADEHRVKSRCIGLTDLAYKIASDHAQQRGFDSTAAYVEWCLLSQQFPQDQVAVIFSRRKSRGERGIVHVLPDDAVLPPEGD